MATVNVKHPRGNARQTVGDSGLEPTKQLELEMGPLSVQIIHEAAVMEVDFPGQESEGKRPWKKEPRKTPLVGCNMTR